MSESKNQSDEFDQIKKLGFELFTNGSVRRITPSIYVVKSSSKGSFVAENKDGQWICDCPNRAPNGESCEHMYAAQLAKNSNRQWESEVSSSSENSLKCRYCGSPDLSKCGFRYNARGISRRYFCHECERKFSIRIVESQQAIVNVPAEVVWILNEVGLQVSRLNELLVQLDSKLTQYSASSEV